jgi:hypothetical protein
MIPHPVGKDVIHRLPLFPEAARDGGQKEIQKHYIRTKI